MKRKNMTDLELLHAVVGKSPGVDLIHEGL
jgi:hypothetical protein